MSTTEKRRRGEAERERRPQMRGCSIIERTADPDGDARKYAARQLFSRLEYRLLLCLRYYPDANRVNYRLAARRLTADSALRRCYYETDQTDITSSSSPNVKLEDPRTSSPDEGSNMECGQSTLEYVCSRCGSRPTTAIKIEERRIVESTYEIIEETSYESCLRYYKDDDIRRVPFPEAGVDIVDRKLKNTQESLDREINEDHDDDILTYTESWTENWLFRKKDDKTTRNEEDATIKPVAMFVPNTTAKYRAMIGDRDVDEMSDLSECSNNDEADEDDELDSGKDAENGVAKYIYDRRARLLLDGESKHHRETSNGHCHESTGGIDGANDAESNRSYRSELFIESYCNDVNHQNTELLSDNDKLLSDIDFNLFSPPRPGTIADREHRKWLTAAPMENNPYSEENLQKRLLERKYNPKYCSLLGHSRINGYDDETIVDNIDFEAIDLPEKSSTPIAERTIVEEEEDKSVEKLNDDDDDTKNKSNGEATIAVTKKNARRRIDDDCASEEKISLPSVRKLVEVFSAYQRKRGIYVKPTKDKDITEPEEIKFERSQPRPLHLHSLTARSLSKEFREGLR